MRNCIFYILFLTLCGSSKAQQGNHWVVQGYQEIVDTNYLLKSDSIKFTNYFDIDLNSPEIAVKKLKSKRITYNYHGPPPNSSWHKISQGYQTISNINGELLAFVFNNVLYNSVGDSLDYLSQYGGKRGIASYIEASDTFTLFYIQSKTEHNAISFESQYFNTDDPDKRTFKFHKDSFF